MGRAYLINSMIVSKFVYTFMIDKWFAALLNHLSKAIINYF